MLEMLTGVLAVLGEKLVDLLADLTIWDLHVVLLVTVVGQQVEETVLRDVELDHPTAVSTTLSISLSFTWCIA